MGFQDSIPSGHAGMPVVVSDPFETMNNTLTQIRDALTGRDPFATQWDLVQNVRASQHIRFRSQTLVLACDGAMNVTLSIGTRIWVFQIAAAGTFTFPFITVVERGTDAMVTPSAGNVTAVYLIGTRE